MISISKRKKILKILGISIFGITPLFLSSCSTNTLIERTVSKNDGTYLDSNTSLSDYSLAALESDTGMKAYLEEIVDEMITNWLTKLSDTANVSYQNSYKNEKTTIDDDYDDLVDEYKTDYGSNWQLKFQQDVLDPAGGTEASYKQSQWNSWATSQFETYLFTNSYLTYKDSNGNIVNPSSVSSSSVSELYTALENENLLFAYPSSTTINADSSASEMETDAIDNAYANFIEYVWNQYVQVENPYIVDMVLWKYGTPSQGLNTLYTNASSTTTSSSDSGSDSSSSGTTTTDADSTSSSDSSGDSSSDSGSSDSDSSSTTATAASYIYPYFGDDTSSSTTTVSKYVSFINAASNATASNGASAVVPFTSNYDTQNYGLLNISNDYTDDSSTYILAKNTSIYSDLYVEFAAASSYLFWRNSNVSNATFDYDTSSSASGIANIDSNISKSIGSDVSKDNDATTGLDPITKLFVSQNNIFTNGSQYELELDSSYVNQVINKDGPLASLRDNPLYVIDSFVPSDDNLTNYMFLRDSAGVHAITIDGYYYINGTSGDQTIGSSSLSASEKKNRAGQVVLFRSLYNDLNGKPSDYSFSVDVQSELKTFYEDNIDWLIYSYAVNNPDNPLFNLSQLSLTTAEKNAAEAINNYLHETSYYTKVDDYNDALYSEKSTYSANYGVDADQNGLAAPWTYQTFTSTDATRYDSNSTIAFQVAATASVVQNPFTTTSSDATTYNYDGSTFILQTDLNATLSTLTATLTALSNSSFDGFKYSQYIYSNSSYVNAGILAFSSESSDLADLSKINYLKKYIGDFFDFDTLQVNSYKITYNGKSYDLASYLNNALANFFFNSTFDSATNKWLKLSDSDNTTWANASANATSDTSTTTTDLTSIVEAYKIKLWKADNAVLTSTSLDNYLSLYTAVASMKYLLQDDASYFLQYLSSQISIGDNVYVAWETSQNTQLEQNSVSSASSLMSASTLNQNINNSFVSSYLGGSSTTSTSDSSSSPLTVTYQSNLDKTEWTATANPNVGVDSLYEDSTDATAYYSIVSGMVGFVGLQTSSSTTLNSVVTDKLFSNPTTDNSSLTGVLYGYGSSFNDVISVIQNTTTLSAINSIAEDLATKLKHNELTAISSDTSLSLSEKKDKLVTALTNLNESSSGVFNQRIGILNGDATSETNQNGLLFTTDDPYLQYSAYVIQINKSDLSSQDTLLKALSNSDDATIDPVDIFANLVVQQAVNSTVQSDILDYILASEGKITAYDVRLYTALGIEWIENWKVTNSSSSSSSSSSSNSSSGDSSSS